MTHVIGLFSRECDYDRSSVELKAAGFLPERIGVISQEQVVLGILGDKSRNFVLTYAGIGAFLGLLPYGISALLATWCQCNLFLFGQTVQLVTFIGGILAGILVGGSIGIFVGIGRLEQVTNIYKQGRDIGGKLMVVNVRSKNANHVRDLLQNDGACEVGII